MGHFLANLGICPVNFSFCLILSGLYTEILPGGNLGYLQKRGLFDTIRAVYRNFARGEFGVLTKEGGKLIIL